MQLHVYEGTLFMNVSTSLICISVLNKEGVFTENRSTVNSFITATLTNIVIQKLIHIQRQNKKFSNLQ